MLFGLFKAHHVHEAFEPLCSAHFKKPVGTLLLFSMSLILKIEDLGPYGAHQVHLTLIIVKRIPFHVNVSNCHVRRDTF